MQLLIHSKLKVMQFLLACAIGENFDLVVHHMNVVLYIFR